MKDNVAAAKAALSHMDIDTSEAAIRAKSRDFFWYSPVLKAHLDHVVADFVVAPKDEARSEEHSVFTYNGAFTNFNARSFRIQNGAVHYP